MNPVVLMGDPAVAGIPVRECGEALVTASADFVMSPLKQADEPCRSMLRHGVHDRLVAAQTHLPQGFRLCWVEGHRQLDLQRTYFEEYRAHLVALDPDLDDEAAFLLTSRHVSPPDVAPHVSGAAIDLTLCDEDGTELDLGTAVNATPEESHGACYFDGEVSAEARSHRAVLARALEEVGLVNYPTEWWHWSYGDRYWAMATGATAAVYGPRPGVER